MKKKKQLYLVKREVLATDINKAMIARGTIYEVALAEDKSQPENILPPLGFKSKKK